MSDDAFKIDQFTIIGDIASGQVSDVFEAVQDGSGKHFALKLLRDDIVQNSMQKESRTILSQFKQEFKLGQLFEHPNLVHVHEIQFKVQTLLPVKEPIAYFTMDYFRSQNLKAAMSSDLLGTQRRLQKMLEQICEAIGYVHSKGWVHRDVKPDNIFCCEDGTLKLMDLGLVRGDEMTVLTMTGQVMGTPAYISPDQINGEPLPASDQYSLGIVLYEILTGQRPFRQPKPEILLY